MVDFLKRHPILVVGVVLVALLAAGTAMNLRLEHLRQSEAFYRWFLAVTVRARMAPLPEEGDVDADLFRRSVSAMETAGFFDDFLAEYRPDPEDGVLPDPEEQAAQDYEIHTRVWNFARSSYAVDHRETFLELARQQQLRFARDIEYAEAQAGGVSIFNLFFGFRKVAANLLWIEVDRYWHQGNMYRMITLMRTCVALDPEFIEAYLIGAWHLAYNATARMPDTPWPQREWHPEYETCLGEKERFYYHAVEFLQQGIQNNPRNYRLYFDLGFAVFKEKLEDYPNAVKYLSEAIRVPHDRWVPRQLFLCYELNEQYEEALAGWQDYIIRYPESMTAIEVAPRFILRNQGHIYERRAQELLREAAETDDATETAAIKARVDEYWERARETWGNMFDPYGDGRLMRMDALELREQGRYLEAIALLDKARWDTAALWQDLSDLIIEIKQEAGIPLSVSEKKAVLRESEVGICPDMPQEEQERRLRAIEEIEATF